MTHSNDPGAQRWRRRLVLGIALTLALAVGLPREPVDAAPAPATPPAAAPGAEAPAKAEADTAAPKGEGDTATPKGDTAGSADITISPRGIIVGKGGRGSVSVHGAGSDHEYDSFEDFINDAPWIAGLVFVAVLLFFLTPLMIVVLFIWYRLRKTRMQNETMLRLAEKGVVNPAEAMQSLAATNPAPQSLPQSAAPLYEQARQLRRRAAWSDLRKGVMFIAVGLGFIFYSMFSDGEPNWVGLTCLFVGLGFCFLWFFEDRQVTPAKQDAGAPPTSSA